MDNKIPDAIYMKLDGKPVEIVTETTNCGMIKTTSFIDKLKREAVIDDIFVSDSDIEDIPERNTEIIEKEQIILTKEVCIDKDTGEELWTEYIDEHGNEWQEYNPYD
jgi:hypothetical protein